MSNALICAWCGKEFERPNAKGPTPLYCSSSHRQRAHEGRQLARMAGASEVIEAAKIPFALSEVSKAVETLRLSEASPMADALKVASRSVESGSAFAFLRTPEFQNIFKNAAAQGSSPIVKEAMKSFAAVRVPPDILGISNLKVAGLFDQTLGDQLKSLSKAHTSALTASFADITTAPTIAAAQGAFESTVLVKNLVPEVEWIKAFGASSAVNAMLAESVGGLSTLAAEIASATARLSTLSLPKRKWFENVDLGVNSWSNLVRVMPPQPSPHQLGNLSVMGTGALAVAETGLILVDRDFSLEDNATDPFSLQRERFRARLMVLGPDLVDRLDGAWERVGRPGPDAASQAAHSLVEFIDWTLRRAAPEEDVLTWHRQTGRPSDELNRSGLATRALKIRYIMRDRADEADSAEMQVRSVTEIMNYLQKKKHSQGDKELRAVARLIPGIEAAFTFILPWDVDHGPS
jgi:hypothetical protein